MTVKQAAVKAMKEEDSPYVPEMDDEVTLLCTVWMGWLPT